MGWEVPIVHECPISKETWGLIEMTPKVIKAIAGAVVDEQGKEWIVCLLGKELGTRRLHFLVDGIYVPRHQTRHGGGCEYDEILPDDIAERKLGVLHSHHQMGVFWSPTDINKLNPFHGLSVVISSALHKNTMTKERIQESMLLGFSYLAVGNGELPCGSLGEIRYHIKPAGVKDWPINHQIVEPDTNKQVDTLRGCHHWVTAKDTTLYSIRKTANCGCEEKEADTAIAVFGRRGEVITALLPPVVPIQQDDGHHHKKHNSSAIVTYYDKDKEIQRGANGSGKKQDAVSVVFRGGYDGSRVADYGREDDYYYTDEYQERYYDR